MSNSPGDFRDIIAAKGLTLRMLHGSIQTITNHHEIFPREMKNAHINYATQRPALASCFMQGGDRLVASDGSLSGRAKE